MSGQSETWATGLTSARSGATAPLHHPPLPVEEAPWMVDYALDPDRGARLRERLPQRPWTLWRYRELLPVEDWASRVDLGGGGTPLIRLRRLFRSRIVAWIKEEGGNPTGSFKARGLALAVTRARELGAPGVQLPWQPLRMRRPPVCLAGSPCLWIPQQGWRLAVGVMAPMS